MTTGAPYGRALRSAPPSEGRAYGFTLVVWSTGQLCSSTWGPPRPADVALSAAAALLVIAAATAGPFEALWSRVRPRGGGERAYGLIHAVSVGAAIASARALTVLPRGPGFFVVPLVAVAVFEVGLAAEVMVAKRE
jgi:hypothetical protein